VGIFDAALMSMYLVGWGLKAIFNAESVVAANPIKTNASVGKTAKDVTCLHRLVFAA
jgi:hypothetical protein